MVARMSAAAVFVASVVGAVPVFGQPAALSTFSTFSLVPATSCGQKAKCYEGPSKELSTVMTLDPTACRQSVIRGGSCVDCEGSHEEYSSLSAARLSAPAESTPLTLVPLPLPSFKAAPSAAAPRPRRRTMLALPLALTHGHPLPL